MHPLLVSTAAATAAALVLLYQFVRYRRWWLRDSGRLSRELPIRRVAFEAFAARLARGPLGPTLDSAVCIVAAGDGAPGGTSDTEAIVLAVLAKDARRMFEFGTATGRTTYLWARNSPPDARVVTLTLAPDQLGAYRAAAGDAEGARRNAVVESAFTRFLYSGTDVEAKVTQLYGDSKALDEAPYAGRCDLIFVDGSHALSYVRSDTEKALRMLRPGGVVLWHDYRHPAADPDSAGVYEHLNALARALPLVRLGDTSLVAYRAPA
jgi:predicted O-methyltransferase YrrM